ncbi:hypothetical protein PAMP_006124 [Pampus punctatissimus]
MSKIMDGSKKNPSEDQVSVNSLKKTPTKVKETLGMMQTLQRCMRHAAEKSPLSSKGKGSKVTATADSAGNGSESTHPQSPSSPSLSTSSSLKSIGSFFQKKDSRKKRVSEEKEEKEEVWEEIGETYTLPEIPQTTLSVMEINKLIETEMLEKAHLNLLALRQEFQQEQERCGENSPTELARKEKDLSLLYTNLRNKINGIVHDSISLPSRNKKLLVHIARIIQEEEKRSEEPGRLPGSWMEAWRKAVDEGVQAKVESIHLEQSDQNVSWLAVHLGRLDKAIVEDSENVGRDLQSSYPRSFRVFSTYVKSYHRAVGQHLKKLEQQVTVLKDLYALLNWIINSYKRIMENLSLQEDMKDENANLQLDDDFLKQLKDKYCCKVKEDMRSSLDRVIQLENEEFWRDRRTPEKTEDFFDSEFHMDIWTKVKGNAVNAGKIDAQLEKKVILSCFEELKEFPRKFEAEFSHHCSSLKPQAPWIEYQITYINSFTSLQQHMENYRDTCAYQVDEFRQEVKRLIIRLIQDLEDQFKEDVKPYLRRMMTKKWLTDNNDFEYVYSRTEQLSQHCALMRPPHVQEFASRLHYQVVREYVSQLMKNNYLCKNRKHENAASKIRQQWNKLSELFEDMETS